MRIRAAVATVALSFLASAAVGQTQTIDLGQNWSPEQKEQFWFTSQGSQLLPYDWFLHLKQASSDQLFRADENLLRLGYVPTKKSTPILNPGALPIGFAQDVDRDGKTYVGFTCAACHTAELIIDKTPVTVEGAPALSDFWQFLSDLVAALDDTATTTTKFKDFANAVLPSSHTQQQEDELKIDLNKKRDKLRQRWLSMPPQTNYGPARLDAFGGLYNQVVAYALGVPTNARVADAPASYPFLWDTHQHRKVQWNGSADNRLPFDLGYAFRNIGEALGVFGVVHIVPQDGIPKYESSIRVDQQKELEDLLRLLRSPVWPKNLPAPDPASARIGEKIYKDTCRHCHQILAHPGDPDRKVHEKMVKVEKVGTDKKFAENYEERFAEMNADTGGLEGHPKLLGSLSKKFGPKANGADIFANAVFGTWAGSFRASGREMETDEKTESQAIRRFSATAQKKLGKYKARPLNGIWATAPYLHNGSVPNISELLKPPPERMKKFWIGSHDFDPDNLGLSVAQTINGFEFDTLQPGNTNVGHPYGTTLTDDQKKALIAFLKTL